jgi:hypothetical protein
VKKIETPAEHKIEIIKNILFPPLELRQETASDGTTIRYHVDHSMDTNLDAALMDLQEGNNDAATQRTINNMVKRLNNLRTMLEAYAVFDDDAKYIIVEDGLEDKDTITP